MKSILNAISSNIGLGISTLAYLGGHFSQSRSQAVNAVRYVSAATALVGTVWRAFGPQAARREPPITPLHVAFVAASAVPTLVEGVQSLVSQLKVASLPMPKTSPIPKPA